MACTRFTNVHREDDKVTRYLRQSSVWSNEAVPVWAVLLARMFNRVATLEEIKHLVYQGDLFLVSARLKFLREQGQQIFSGAYTISTCGQKMDKVDYVLGVVDTVRRCDDTDSLTFTSLAGLHSQLMRINGLGSFLSAQVVADLKNIKEHPLYAAPDWYTWSAPGPGSLAGLAAYFERKITTAHYHQALENCWNDVRPLLPEFVLPIHRQDFQNCLCEYSKYSRVKAGGRARNTYHAAALRLEASVA